VELGDKEGVTKPHLEPVLLITEGSSGNGDLDDIEIFLLSFL